MAEPRAGDIVSRRKGIVMHRGIVLDDGDVFHNTPFGGEHRSSMSEFRDGKIVYKHGLSPQQRRRVLNATEEPEYRSYNPFTNNCEHTVTRALDGNSRSPQLASLVISGGVALATFALTRSVPLSVAGFALSRKLTSRSLED